MAVVRVEKTKDFTVISNYHLKDKSLSLKAIGLMSKMLSLPDDWDYSINGLVAICKENETAIKGALKELETSGYLIRQRMQNEKGQFEYEYYLYEKPLEEKPQAENPSTDNPSAENVGQLNTNQLNTKELNTNGLNAQSDKIATEPPDPPIITLPLNTGKEYPVTQDMINEFYELYPNVNILQEFKNMRGWCINNPTRRKTKSGIRRFINSWLAKEQNKGTPRKESTNIFGDDLAF